MWLTTLVLTTVLAADKPRIAILDMQRVGTTEAQVSAVSQAMSQEVTKRGYFQVMTSADLRTLLGVERQKAMLGCEESSCMNELSGALGARFVLSSTLTKLGDAVQFSVQMLDSEKGQTVSRVVRIARNETQLIAMLPWAMAEATGTPMPPAPSKVLPWTLIGGGAVLFAGGAIVAIDGFSRERRLRIDLRDLNGVYQSRDVYVDEIETIKRNEWGGGAVALVGAALVGVGVLLFPKDTGVPVALLPTNNGAVLVGVLP